MQKIPCAACASRLIFLHSGTRVTDYKAKILKSYAAERATRVGKAPRLLAHGSLEVLSWMKS
jgi:hypothetical protein